ncbi:MAG: MerR family transcriptional regulator [Thermodesulfobacteriota bacterium]
MEKKPLYTIGVVADLMGVHPETLRVWERHGLLKPPRKHDHRLYTDQDLKRLSFIQGLLDKGLNLAGVAYHLTFYPCWFKDGCLKCMRQSVRQGCAKPCWKERGTFCQVSFEEQGLCEKCEYRQEESQTETEKEKWKRGEFSVG